MTTETHDPATFDVPDDDRAAYDAIPDGRIAETVAAYWRQPGATQAGAAAVAHRRRLALVEADRESKARTEADMATYRWSHTCGAEGGGGPLCRPCRLVREAIDTEAALATATADGRDRREAVARFVVETEEAHRAARARNQAALVDTINRDRASRGATT